MSPDTVHFANEIASLVYTMAGIVAALMMVLVGAVSLWIEHRQMKKRLKALEEQMAEAEQTQTQLDSDINQATSAWNTKLLDFRRDVEDQRLALAVRCGRHDAEVEVLKQQAQQTLTALSSIHDAIDGLRDQFFQFVKEQGKAR